MKKRVFIAIISIILLPVLIINLTIIIKGKINPDVIPDFLGYKPFVVLSGSMTGVFEVGDLVIVKNTPASSIRENDIIAFREDDIVITHRVISIKEENGKYYFITKGDANNAEDDNLVSEDKIEGIYVRKISKLGNVFMFLSEPLGMMVVILFTIVVAGVIYLMLFKNERVNAQDMQEFLEYKKMKNNK